MQSVNLPFTTQFISAGDEQTRPARLARKAVSRQTRPLQVGEYRQLVREVRRAAKAAIPSGATVVVISKGDHQLLNLGARDACHFPQEPSGCYSGHHPADSAEAIAELEAARGSGAGFLVIPATSFWWLEFYQDFARHLATHYRLVIDEPDICVIYQLAETNAVARTLVRGSAEMLKRMWKLMKPSTLGRCCGLNSALRLDNSLPNLPDGFRVALDSHVPRKLVVGEGTAIYVTGWCYHPAEKIASLELVGNGQGEPVKSWRFPRPDVYAAHHPHSDCRGHSYHSGFGGIVSFAKVTRSISVPLVLRATLGNGTVIERELTRVILEPGTGHKINGARPSSDAAMSLGAVARGLCRVGAVSGVAAPEDGRAPLVAICMATFNPPLDLFRRQIESIKKQTFRNWVCIISDDGSRPDIFEKTRCIIGDDPRFKIHRAQTGLGFYGNFERCLSLVPEKADFVALSDQDDYWRPDKLQTLLAAFDSETTLVYSDMRIVEKTGEQIAASYWTTRPNNYTRFGSLLMANCITGAAAMFRRSLLSLVLPFPERIGEAYHDHWIGVVALAAGKIKYVDRPLYDYVQHGTNVIGHHAPAVASPFFPLGFSWRRPWHSLVQALHCWEPIYFFDLLRIQLITRMLLLRCGPLMTDEKKAEARRIEAVDQSWRSSLWLARRAFCHRGRMTETVGAERRLLGAVLWKFCGQSRFWCTASGLRKRRAAAVPSAGATAIPSRGRTDFIQQKIAPLSLKVTRTAPPRLNMLIPTIDLNYFFGGYISKFNLARRLAGEGYKVRMVIVDACDWQPARWQEQFQKFSGLERFFEQVEVVYAHDRSVRLEVSCKDKFIATTWWTAHIAHRAVKDLGDSRFLYLIQEYEPFTFAMGTFAALAGQSYEFPHYAIFSTELLRDYFRQNELGVFSSGASVGDANSIAFQNAITDVGRVTRQDLEKRPRKRLLYYARPEPHAERNMFDLGVLALTEAIKSGYFDETWEFYGIGTQSSASRLPLADGRVMSLLPRDNQETYRDILRSHDLGLALMFTPHPSLVPIEMASAGMLVVTNTYGNKTSKALSAISSNIIAAHPSIEGIKRGLLQAAAQIDDIPARVRGSRVNWATNWQSAFNRDLLAKIRTFVERSAGVPPASSRGVPPRGPHDSRGATPPKLAGGTPALRSNGAAINGHSRNGHSIAAG